MKNNISVKYGIILFIALASFFGVMWMAGQADKTWLRIFNGVIHLSILYLAISVYRRENPRTLGNYLSGVGVGMSMSLIGSLLFAFFIAGIVALDENLSQAIYQDIPYAFNTLPLSSGLFVMMEGIVAGLIGSYIMVRVVNAKILKEKTGQALYNVNYERNAQVG
jgi:hypothetical protein